MSEAPANPSSVEADLKRLSEYCRRLRKIEKPVRILRNLAWPLSVRESFFKHKAQRLPQPEYPHFDAEPALAALQDFRNSLPRQLPGRKWLKRLSHTASNTAKLLAARQTPRFLEYSSRLFGQPREAVLDGRRNALDLAKRLDQTIGRLGSGWLGLPQQQQLSAQAVKQAMEAATQRMFKERAPAVELVSDLSANALAGSRRIRIREDAVFSQRDVHQLVHHEAGIHVATALNGRRQTRLPILASAHAGTTRTQEGLAVFSEFITGSIDLDRLERLSDRVMAIQMAVDGADFIEVFRYFKPRQDSVEQAFESTRRVFRGGVISGGAPFTKDIVYLDGLIRVHNFLRVAISEGRADVLPVMFCGKLDLEDIPMLTELAVLGVVKKPAYVPDWIRDPRFLIAYLAYSAFLNTIDLKVVSNHYRKALSKTPILLQHVAAP